MGHLVGPTDARSPVTSSVLLKGSISYTSMSRL
jgi:hypothetical protein